MENKINFLEVLMISLILLSVVALLCLTFITVNTYITVKQFNDNNKIPVEYLINDSDSLIAKNTYLVTDSKNLGFTFDVDIANFIASQDSSKIVHIEETDFGVYYWFTLKGTVPNFK